MANKMFTLVEASVDLEGGEVGVDWLGFHIHDDRGVAVRYSQASEFNLKIFRVAGVTYRADILQRPQFDPGKVLALVPDPSNAFDKHAVGVWDKDRRLMVGFVPREDNEYFRVALKISGTGALALAEHRMASNRVSLTVLFGPIGINKSP
jgi:hypothetical protein